MSFDNHCHHHHDHKPDKCFIPPKIQIPKQAGPIGPRGPQGLPGVLSYSDFYNTATQTNIADGGNIAFAQKGITSGINPVTSNLAGTIFTLQPNSNYFILFQLNVATAAAAALKLGTNILSYTKVITGDDEESTLVGFAIINTGNATTLSVVNNNGTTITINNNGISRVTFFQLI